MTSLYKDSAMEQLITRSIRAAMVQEGMTYADLAAALAKLGIKQSESTLRSKVSKGTMAASLFLHIMSCTNTEEIRLPEIMRKYQKLKTSNIDDNRLPPISELSDYEQVLKLTRGTPE